MRDNSTDKNNENNALDAAPEEKALTPPVIKPDAQGMIEYNGERVKVPPELLDRKTGAINPAAAVKRAIDLRRLVSKPDSPAVPEDYVFNVPEPLQEAVDLDAEAPVIKSAVEAAKKAGLSQAQFDGMIGAYLQNRVDEANSTPPPVDEQAELQKIYGDKAQATLDRLHKMVPAAFPEVMRDDALRGVFENLSAIAQGVRLLEAMTNRLKEPSSSPIRGRGQRASVAR